jgi:hypothetical protein
VLAYFLLLLRLEWRKRESREFLRKETKAFKNCTINKLLFQTSSLNIQAAHLMNIYKFILRAPDSGMSPCHRQWTLKALI